MFLKLDFSVGFGAGHLGVRMGYCSLLLVIILKRNHFGSEGCKELKVCISEKLLGRLFQAKEYLSYFTFSKALICSVWLSIWFDTFFLFLLPLDLHLAERGKRPVCLKVKNPTSL